jgi:hypothetical protein
MWRTRFFDGQEDREGKNSKAVSWVAGQGSEQRWRVPGTLRGMLRGGEGVEDRRRRFDEAKREWGLVRRVQKRVCVKGGKTG